MGRKAGYARGKSSKEGTESANIVVTSDGVSQKKKEKL